MPASSQQKLYETPRVGGDILHYCSRCKMDMAHVVVSMVEDNPAKILCKTCHSERRYRAPKRKRTLSAAGAPRPTPRRLKSSALWDEKMAIHSNKPLRNYSARESYVVGDLVKHVKFGVGIVEDLRGLGKILILFRDGERILVHGMGQP